MKSPPPDGKEIFLNPPSRRAKLRRPKEEARALALAAIADGKSREDAAEASGLTIREVIHIETELLARKQHGILVKSYLEHRKELLPEVLRCGLNLLANGLKHRLDDPEPLSLREAEIVSRIVSNIDHIARLDAGDPTQIIDVNRTVPATLKDIVATLKQDPFIDTVQLVKELEFNEVTEGNDSGRENTEG